MDGSHPISTGASTALGFSITANLGDNRQIVVQSFVPLDADARDIDHLLDKVMGRLDRQKARYELDALAEEIETQSQTLRQYEGDKARIDHEHEIAQAQRRIELQEREATRASERKAVEAQIDSDILTLNQTRQSVWADGEAEARRSGKLGAYKPVGIRAQNLAKIDAGIDQALKMKTQALEQFEADYDARIAALQAEIEKADQERRAADLSMVTAIDRYTKAIAANEAKLAKTMKLLEG